MSENVRIYCTKRTDPATKDTIHEYFVTDDQNKVMEYDPNSKIVKIGSQLSISKVPSNSIDDFVRADENVILPGTIITDMGGNYLKDNAAVIYPPSCSPVVEQVMEISLDSYLSILNNFQEKTDDYYSQVQQIQQSYNLRKKELEAEKNNAIDNLEIPSLLKIILRNPVSD